MPEALKDYRIPGTPGFVRGAPWLVRSWRWRSWPSGDVGFDGGVGHRTAILAAFWIPWTQNALGIAGSHPPFAGQKKWKKSGHSDRDVRREPDRMAAWILILPVQRC